MRQRGFTLVELLIVIAIIGIITVVAVPQLTNALDRGRARGTMMNIRNLAAAVQNYSVDHVRYPQIGSLSALEEASQLGSYLDGEYLSKVPEADAWGGPLMYGSDGEHFTLRSYGKDGKLSTTIGGQTKNMNEDIVFVDGQFIQWPSGQSKGQ